MNSLEEQKLEELLSTYKEKREKEIYEEIYNKYNKLVFKIAYSILKNKENSEDIMQNIFLKIYNLKEENFPSKHVMSWLYKITKNEALTYLRKSRIIEKETAQYKLENLEEKDDLEEIIDLDTYNRIVKTLNNREKEIISLKVISQFSFSEIAKMLKKPEGTIKWQYYKSLNKLKIIISNFGLGVVAIILGLNIMYEEKEYIQYIEKEVVNSEVSNEYENDIKSDEYQDIIQNTTITEEIYSKETIITKEGTIVLSIGLIFFTLTIYFLISLLKTQLFNRLKKSK